MGKPPKRDERSIGEVCSEQWALDGPPPRKPFVPKWKRFLVQNTRGSIRRELSDNGEAVVSGLIPWPSSIVPGYGKPLSPRVQRIRYPGVNPRTPICERPLTLPYRSAGKNEKPKRPSNSDAKRPPWAIGENFQPASMGRLSDEVVFTDEERAQAFLRPQKEDKKIDSPWAIGMNFQPDSGETEDGKNTRRNRRPSFQSSPSSAASPQMSSVPSRVPNSSAANPPWALRYEGDDDSGANSDRRSRRRDKSRDKPKETLPICPGAQKADQDKETNK